MSTVKSLKYGKKTEVWGRPSTTWAWILQHGITWQHPDILAMPNKANVLSWTSADKPCLDFSFNGGSAVDGRTNMPSFFKQNEVNS